jgi:hypothetical protein
MEDKIRKLCQQAVEEKDPEKATAFLHQLRDSIHVHIERLREKIATYPDVEERRATGELADTVVG